MDLHSVFSTFSDLTGPLSPAEFTVYICWNPAMTVKFVGKPECWEGPLARLHIITSKEEGVPVQYTDIPLMLCIKN